MITAVQKNRVLNTNTWLLIFIILQAGIIILSSLFSWYVLASIIGLIIAFYTLRSTLRGLVVLILLHALILKQTEGINVAEVIYGAYFGLFFISWIFRKILIRGESFIESKSEYLLVAFFILCLFSIIPTVLMDGYVFKWFREIIPFLTLLLYFPMIDAMKTRRGKSVLGLAFLILALSVGVQNVLGYRENLNAAIYFWEVASARQVANEPLFFAAVLVLFGIFMYSHANLFRIISAFLILFFGLALVVTFSRGYWIATVLGIGAIFLFLDAPRKVKFTIVAGIFVLITMGAMYMFFGSFMPFLSKSLAERAGSIASAQADLSMLNRLSEFKSIFSYIIRNPIMGYGLGSEFKYFNIIHHVTLKSSYSHNAYLYLWFKLGIFGLLTFLGFYFMNLFACLKVFKRTTELVDKGILLGMLGMFIAMIPLSITSPQFIQKDSILIIALACSYITVVREKLSQVGSE